MKKLLLVFFLVLVSCSQNQIDIKNPEISTWNITQPTQHIQNIWDTSIIFDTCQTYPIWWRWYGWWITPATPDEKIIDAALQKHPLKRDISGNPWYKYYIWEYCKNKDGKYILMAFDNSTIIIARYDSAWDIFQEATYVWNYLSGVVWWFGKNGVFGKRDTDNLIPIKSEDHSIYGTDLSFHEKVLKKDKNKQFCKSRSSTCSYSIEYNYDYVTNEVREKNICSFYKDKNNITQVLESCFDVKY